MKKIYQCLLLSLLFSCATLAQSFLQTVTLSPTAYKVVYVYYGGTSFQYYEANNYSIGHQSLSSPFEDHVWRSMYQFDLSSSSIPANAIITNATLQSYVTGSNLADSMIVKMLSPSVNPSDSSLKAIFNGAITGTTKVRRKYTDTVYTNVTNDIIARCQYGKVVYGGSCSQEQYTTSKALLNLQLTIKYYFPFSVTTQNNFTGGKMGIVAPGINDTNTTVPYSKTDTKLADAFTLTAKAQTDNTGYSRVWNTSSTNQSKWTKDGKYDIGSLQGYNVNKNFNADSTDAEARYTANLRKLYNVTRYDQTVDDGGTMYMGITQVVEQNTILAQSTKTINGQEYVFLSWSDGVIENPRLITDHTILTALYKAHLASNNQSVTHVRGQCQLATAEAGRKQVMVYESAGEIWSTTRYSNSLPVNLPWNPEKRVSSGNGNNFSPSAVIRQNTNDYYAVWERVSSTEHFIYFAKSTNGMWQTPQVLAVWNRTWLPALGCVLPELDSRPVIAAFRNGNSQTILHAYYTRPGWIYGKKSVDGGATWSDISNASMQSWFPNIDGNYNPFHLVATSSSNSWIYHMTGSYGSNYWNSGEIVPGSYAVNYSGEPEFETYTCAGPQVRVHGSNRMFFGWWEYQLCGTDHYFYVVQSKDQNRNWSAPVAYEGDGSVELSMPSLAVTPYNAVMMWSEGAQMKKVVWNYPTATWGTVPQNVSTGIYPSLGQGCPELTSVAPYLLTQAGSPLARIGDNAVSGLLRKSGDVACGMKYARVLFAADTVTQQTFSVSMSQPMLNGKQIPFVAINDTLPGIDAKNFFEYLISQQMKVATNSDTLEFALSISSRKFEGRSFPMPLTIDGMYANGKIGSVAVMNCDLKNKQASVSVKKAVKNLQGKELHLRPIGVSLESLGKNWVFGVAHVYLRNNEKSVLSKEQQIGEIAANIPMETKLGQNYPNPFNPATVINYQLSATSRINLKVYDVIGREVAILVDDTKEAGYYSASFDGSKLSSGIYFVRFVASPSDHSKPFMQTMKMLMLK